MSALDTIDRVLQWASDPHISPIPPPVGQLTGIKQLTDPPASLCIKLAVLCAKTAAHLRIPASPCGDTGPIGLGGLLIAAAVSAAHTPTVARAILFAVGDRTSPREWIARHGVAGPALRFLPADIADDCRALSPLTALLDFPATGKEAEPLWAAQTIIAYMAPASTAERTALTHHFAKPSTDPRVRKWRTEILDRMRNGNEIQQRFVLDVYEATMIHHRELAFKQAQDARSVLSDPIASADNERLSDARSVAEWWGPLANLERTHLDLLRARRYLDYEYREGIALFRLERRLAGGPTP